MAQNKFIIEKASRFDFEKTVETLIASAGEHNWNIPAVHDLQQSLAKSGKTVNPVKVIEICKPAYSGKMLELNDERIMSVMMPCRISVYIKDDGKTYLALLDGAAMSAGMPQKIAEVMKAASDETLVIAESVV
jgi:uncharacterized protein (DUF302 family)